MSPKFQEYLAAVDIGGTKITVSIANREGIAYKVFQPVAKAGPNTAVPIQVNALIEHAAVRSGITKGDIVAVGVSTCSPFEIKGGKRVVVAPNLCGGLAVERGVIPNDWTEIPLEEELTKLFPRVEVKNDCVAAVAAERLFGAGQGEDNLAYITWSTGIGSGAYVDGRLISGKEGNAPHMGHFVMENDGPQCGCGKFGHIEALSSGVAIARDYGEGITTQEVFARYKNNDARAAAVVENAAKYFARGLSAMNAILDTRLFVIGGSVFMNNRKILLPLIEKTFFEESFPALVKGVKIQASPLESYLGDLAALSLVMPDNWIEIWKKNTPWISAPEVEVLTAGSETGAPSEKPIA